jgi:hypothetical protein
MFKKKNEDLSLTELENEERKLGDRISHLHEILVSRKASYFDTKEEYDIWRKQTEGEIHKLRTLRGQIKQKINVFKEKHFESYWLQKLQPHLPSITVGTGRINPISQSNIARILQPVKVNEKFETCSDIVLPCGHKLSKGFNVLQHLISMAKKGKLPLETSVEPLLHGLIGKNEYAFDFDYACSKRGHRVQYTKVEGFREVQYYPKTVHMSLVVYKPASS